MRSQTKSVTAEKERMGSTFSLLWAFLVSQLVKNLLAMRETWVQSLGWEDPLEEGMAIPSSILAWRIPMDKGVWQACPWGRMGSQRVRHD